MNPGIEKRVNKMNLIIATFDTADLGQIHSSKTGGNHLNRLSGQMKKML